MPIIDWGEKAEERGYYPLQCRKCCGHADVVHYCAECEGSGKLIARCACGAVGTLYSFAEEHICAKCAATCSNCCEHAAVVSELEDRDPLCLACHITALATTAV